MASIQQSLNSLFAASLGAGFAVSQTPGIQEYAAQRAERKQVNKEYEALKQQTEVVGKDLQQTKEGYEKMPEVIKKVSGERREKEIQMQEELLADLNAERADKQVELAGIYLKQGRVPEGLKGAEAVFGGAENLTSSFYAQSLLNAKKAHQRQAELQKAKEEVSKAVSRRRDLINELKAMGINPDNAKGITDIKTKEKIK